MHIFDFLLMERFIKVFNNYRSDRRVELLINTRADFKNFNHTASGNQIILDCQIARKYYYCVHIEQLPGSPSSWRDYDPTYCYPLIELFKVLLEINCHGVNDSCSHASYHTK